MPDVIETPADSPQTEQPPVPAPDPIDDLLDGAQAPPAADGDGAGAAAPADGGDTTPPPPPFDKERQRVEQEAANLRKEQTRLTAENQRLTAELAAKAAQGAAPTPPAAAPPDVGVLQGQIADLLAKRKSLPRPDAYASQAEINDYQNAWQKATEQIEESQQQLIAAERTRQQQILDSTTAAMQQQADREAANRAINMACGWIGEPHRETVLTAMKRELRDAGYQAKYDPESKMFFSILRGVCSRIEPEKMRAVLARESREGGQPEPPAGQPGQPGGGRAAPTAKQPAPKPAGRAAGVKLSPAVDPRLNGPPSRKSKDNIIESMKRDGSWKEGPDWILQQ